MRSEGWQSCVLCPPRGFCGKCSSINRQRHQAGLIYGYGDPRYAPSPDNIALEILQGKYRGHRPLNYKQAKKPIVTAYIKKLGGGWYKGAAMLNGMDVYVQLRATRVRDEAFAYANERAKIVKDGLRYEAGLC